MNDRGHVRVTLRKTIGDALRAGHPWVYRDAVESVSGAAGTLASVVDRRGSFVARGVIDGEGPIAIRVFTTNDEPVDEALMRDRVAQASRLRRIVVPPATNAFRLVHGEGDRLPGFVCDVYGEYAVARFDGDGAHELRAIFFSAIESELRAIGVTTLLARIGRKAERTTETIWGAAPKGHVVVREHGRALRVDLIEGQKTGLFLDHRESRERVCALARGRRVLNLYGYTGAFSVAAALGGATHVTTVDIAAPALALARESFGDNAISTPHDVIVDDAPTFLKAASQRGDRWDLVIADPPSFAPSEAAVPSALSAYRSLHEASLAVLAPHGLYLAASCSSHVDRERFVETLANAAARRRAVLQIIDEWHAPADHPRLLAFPEGDYLKCVLTRPAA